MIAYWPPFDPTSVIPAPPTNNNHYWKSQREQVQRIDTIASATCTIFPPQHSSTSVCLKASAPMCSCVLMSGLYLRFREADNLDLSLSAYFTLISYHTESLTLVPSATLFGFAFRSACIYSCSVNFAAPSHFIRETVVGFTSNEWIVLT